MSADAEHVCAGLYRLQGFMAKQLLCGVDPYQADNRTCCYASQRNCNEKAVMLADHVCMFQNRLARVSIRGDHAVGHLCKCSTLQGVKMTGLS